MQIQIYVKPQDEKFFKELSERAKSYEFKGVKSLSELILLALKNYDPKASSFDVNDKDSMKELINKLIDEKLDQKLKELLISELTQSIKKENNNDTIHETNNIISNSSLSMPIPSSILPKSTEILESTEKIKPSKKTEIKEKEKPIEKTEIQDLDSLSKKDLVSLISDFKYTGTQRDLFKKAKATYTEKASLQNQKSESLKKVASFIQSQKV